MLLRPSGPRLVELRCCDRAVELCRCLGFLWRPERGPSLLGFFCGAPSGAQASWAFCGAPSGAQACWADTIKSRFLVAFAIDNPKPVVRLGDTVLLTQILLIWNSKITSFRHFQNRTGLVKASAYDLEMVWLERRGFGRRAKTVYRPRNSNCFGLVRLLECCTAHVNCMNFFSRTPTRTYRMRII